MAKFHLAISELVRTMTDAGVEVSGSCTILTDVASTCPLCRTYIPPRTRHACTVQPVIDVTPPKPKRKR
jgi:hypothetical protein